MPWIDAVITLVCWGFWAFLPKLAVKHLPDSFSPLLFQHLGSLICVVGFGATRGSLVPGFSSKGVLFAGLAGVAATLGMAFYYRAAARLPVSVVSVTTALYPVVSVALALLVLGERLTPRQWVGAALALIAVGLLAPTS